MPTREDLILGGSLKDLQLLRESVNHYRYFNYRGYKDEEFVRVLQEIDGKIDRKTGKHYRATIKKSPSENETFPSPR